MAAENARRPRQATPAAVAALEPRLFERGPQLAPRRHSVLHSHVVSLLKMLLPAVAVGLVALVLLWPQLNPLERSFRLKPVAVSIDDLENLRMLNPRYVGSDSQNQPYTLTADQATQLSGDSNITDLVKPKGDISLKDGSWIALTADAGTYRKQNEILDLEGNVDLFQDGGYEIVTERARIDLENGTAEGNDPVSGQGPDTELQGQGFRVYDRGNRILTTGQSRLVIRQAPEAAVHK